MKLGIVGCGMAGSASAQRVIRAIRSRVSEMTESRDRPWRCRPRLQVSPIADVVAVKLE